MKLGGWQRIWIVISVMWLLVVGLVGYSEIPSEEKIYKAWSYDLLKYLCDNDSNLKGQYAWQLRDVYSDLSDKELIERLRSKYLEKYPAYKYGFENIDAKYNDKLINLARSRVIAIGIGFLIWFIPLAVLYVLGWSVGWIYRGFRGV